MSGKYGIVKDPPKALTFDVFGTVVSCFLFIFTFDSSVYNDESILSGPPEWLLLYLCRKPSLGVEASCL